jgi:CRISPR/Cas system-associated exonuclease Cas4 (RecB family)
MNLPDNFVFSQGNLQDYVDCKRRFQLRYIERRSWPAIKAEPALVHEEWMQLGARFHRMVEQALSGVPAEQINVSPEDEKLSLWWRNYLSLHGKLTGIENAPEEELSFFPELTLSAGVGGYRLLAKYDLIVITSAGQLVIYDWKTSVKRPRREWLADRLQTRVYPYLLVRAGQTLTGGLPVPPEKVSMVYWFAGYPDDPERFPYNQPAFERDSSYLEGLINEISGLEPTQFTLTDVLQQCTYCQYRSLCDRGTRAGEFTGEEAEGTLAELSDLLFDLDTIPEIGYD